MANRVKPIIRLSLLLSLGALTTGTGAQTAPLADPTRPPVSVSMPLQDAETVTGPVLQSVMSPKKGKPIALIGGQQVKLGEMYGESRLIKLTEREAVLEGPAGIERLMLTPGIEKTNITTKSPAPKRARSGGKP